MITSTLEKALSGINKVLWGDCAVGYYGYPTVICQEMLILADEDMKAAQEALEFAGFTPKTWSSVSIFDPSTFGTDDARHIMYRKLAEQFKSLDDNCVRYEYPKHLDERTQVMLFPSSYNGIKVPTSPETAHITIGDHLYLPSQYELLHSILYVLLKKGAASSWALRLQSWAFLAVHEVMGVDDHVLDNCGDEEMIKFWYKSIKQQKRGKFSGRRSGRKKLNGSQAIKNERCTDLTETTSNDVDRSVTVA